MAFNLNKSNTVLAKALIKYIQRRKQRGLLALFGKIEYDPNYDHKQGRKKR